MKAEISASESSDPNDSIYSLDTNKEKFFQLKI